MAKVKKEIKVIKDKLKAVKFNDLPESIIIDLIEKDACNPYTNDIAKILGVGWLTVQNYLVAHPAVNKIMLDRRFEIRDKAELTINRILDDPEVDKKTKADLSKWVLKNTDPKRYGEIIDVNLGGEVVIKIKGLEDIDI